MKRIILSVYLALILLLIFPACDHGLKPTEVNSEEKSGITGYISYQNWPTPDSLVDLRLVIFRYYPPDNILTEVLSGNAKVHPGLNDSSLPFYKDTTEFVVELDPGVYEYVVVAQQYGSNISADWLAVGQYDTVPENPLPTNITVEPGIFLQDININVNFNDRPLQPF